jgi:hypothetical protein
LLAFRASGYFERNTLVLLQRLEASRLNRREVSEQIFAAFVRGDKAETFESLNHFTIPVAITIPISVNLGLRP